MKSILVFLLTLVLAQSIVNAQETKTKASDVVANEQANSLLSTYRIGYSAITSGGANSDGFNIGFEILNLSNSTNLFYGIDFSYSGFFKKGIDYQSLLTIGPTVGLIFAKGKGFNYGLGLTSSQAIVKVYGENGILNEGMCLNGKSKIWIGYNHYSIYFEGGYYTSSKFDFSTFSINLQYQF